jgi:protease I
MRRYAILLVLSLATLILSAKEPPMNTLQGKRVVMIIASHDFRDEEFAEPFTLLKQAGASVTVASSQRQTATGMLGKQVVPDLLIADVRMTNYDAIIFVGGGGAEEYFANPVAHQIAQQTVKEGKLLCAICVAPAILANAGVLKGKRATCFPSVAPALRKAGATVVAEGVVQDGQLITADGPQSAAAFARTVAQHLGR